MAHNSEYTVVPNTELWSLIHIKGFALEIFRLLELLQNIFLILTDLIYVWEDKYSYAPGCKISSANPFMWIGLQSPVPKPLLPRMNSDHFYCEFNKLLRKRVLCYIRKVFFQVSFNFLSFQRNESRYVDSSVYDLKCLPYPLSLSFP